jgi:hypothetical protein
MPPETNLCEVIEPRVGEGAEKRMAELDFAKHRVALDVRFGEAHLVLSSKSGQRWTEFGIISHRQHGRARR